MLAIVDYGAGNLFSLMNSLEYLEIPYCVAKESETLEKADGIILPGVGAFPHAMKQLKDSKMLDTLLQEVSVKKKPFLGICLGMQLLFETGYEFQETKGLGLLPGSVEQMKPLDEEGKMLHLPHIGWNQLEFSQEITSPLLKGLSNGCHMYFVHSFKAVCPKECVAASCTYGGNVPALVQKDNIFGAQFHPEKSSRLGLKMLLNFGKLL